jgi:hypothetical protein
MRSVVRASVTVCLAVAVAAASVRATRASEAPFVVTASTGPAAGSRITATVTRVVDGVSVTLPAALVPALVPGDIVDATFPDYRRPPSTVNYHVNVAFITEIAPQRWLFPRSGPADQLFENPQPGRRHPVLPGGHLHFVYGEGDHRGIPIFTIVPEDAKTRGVDGVRDYVDAHPTDFVDMAESTDNAVDQYSYLNDFLTALASGAIEPTNDEARIEGAAQAMGVSPATIQACYTAGGGTAAVTNCIQQSFDGVMLPTNIAAPTQAEFLGGVAGAAEPLSLAPYISSLLTVWKLFVHTGHIEYEYLPATISLADPANPRRGELLLGLKVPTIRPPAAVSDVLFFTIGDPQATANAPTVVNEAPADGVCERRDRFTVPLHLDHTSRYVHDTALAVTPDGRGPTSIPLDPRSLDAPIVSRSQFAGSSNGAYDVSLHGRFGFDAIGQPAEVAARLAFPSAAPWQVTPVPYHPPIAGGTLDVIAHSPGAACLSRAEVQIGSAPPVALAATHLDDERVELKASLTDLPAGPAQIRFYEDDPAAHVERESSADIAIAAPPPAVDERSAVAAIGDAFVHLAGSGFERIRGVLIAGTAYAKQPGSSATAACFDGPPLGNPAWTAGERLTAQLLPVDGSAGQIFPLTLEPPRPALAIAQLVPPPGTAPTTPTPATVLSTDPLTVMLDNGSATLPRQLAVRVRRADDAATTPCASMQPDPTAATLPAGSAQVRSPHDVAVTFRADVLGDRAFGTLELQIVDTASGLGSPWATIPPTFVRAPTIAQIVCGSDATVPCRLYGAQLNAIDAVSGDGGAFVAPGLDCPPSDKGVACVYVPHAAHLTLRLVDGATIEPLSDLLLVKTKG